MQMAILPQYQMGQSGVGRELLDILVASCLSSRLVSSTGTGDSSSELLLNLHPDLGRLLLHRISYQVLSCILCIHVGNGIFHSGHAIFQVISSLLSGCFPLISLLAGGSSLISGCHFAKMLFAMHPKPENVCAKCFVLPASQQHWITTKGGPFGNKACQTQYVLNLG